MSDTFVNEINQQLAQLTPGQQQDVLSFVRNLQSQTPKEEPQAAKKRLERRQALLDLAGSISPEDLEIMKSVIEADCGQVDPNGW